jgi:hypothetical protein
MNDAKITTMENGIDIFEAKAQQIERDLEFKLQLLELQKAPLLGLKTCVDICTAALKSNHLKEV